MSLKSRGITSTAKKGAVSLTLRFLPKTLGLYIHSSRINSTTEQSSYFVRLLTFKKKSKTGVFIEAYKAITK